MRKPILKEPHLKVHLIGDNTACLVDLSESWFLEHLDNAEPIFRNFKAYDTDGSDWNYRINLAAISCVVPVDKAACQENFEDEMEAYDKSLKEEGWG